VSTLRRHPAVTAWVVLSALSLTAPGCGRPADAMPPVHRVTGTVTYAGGEPVVNGGIQFMPVGDSSYSVSGEIQADGSFTLYTVKGSVRAAGAPEGEYQVSVQPPIPADHRPVPAVSLPKTYKVEAKDNTFAIEIPKGKK
jgi:hypothetical protein